MYELHKTWCADTLLSNSVICAIGVLQLDKQKCWSPKCISSALLEPRPLSICDELNSLIFDIAVLLKTKFKRHILKEFHCYSCVFCPGHYSH